MPRKRACDDVHFRYEAGPPGYWAVPADPLTWARMHCSRAIVDSAEGGGPCEDQPSGCCVAGQVASRRGAHRGLGSRRISIRTSPKDNGDPNPSRHGRRGQFIGKMGVVANRLLSATARGDGANFHRASRENGDQLAACRSETQRSLGSSNDNQPIDSSITDLGYSLMRILIPAQQCSPTIQKWRTSRQMVAFSFDRTFP